MVSEKDRRVLTISLYAILGLLAFFLINWLLEGRVPKVIWLPLGGWVMQLITYPISDKEVSFPKFAVRPALGMLIAGVTYSLVTYLWQRV